eukprot:RCo005279
MMTWMRLTSSGNELRRVVRILTFRSWILQLLSSNGEGLAAVSPCPHGLLLPGLAQNWPHLHCSCPDPPCLQVISPRGRPFSTGTLSLESFDIQAPVRLFCMSFFRDLMKSKGEQISTDFVCGCPAPFLGDRPGEKASAALPWNGLYQYAFKNIFFSSSR